MKSQNDLLKILVGHLEASGIPYMVSGSIGSTFYGKPRATQDIDIVVEADEKQLRAFAALFGEGYYVSESAIREAVAYARSFNIIDYNSGFKADIIVRKKRPFSIEEFSRKRTVRVGDDAVFMVSPEDSILSKLEWSKASSSERQFADACGVAAVQWERLDVDYLKKWAAVLGVADLLERLIAQVRP
jgi:hypothetical protein